MMTAAPYDMLFNPHITFEYAGLFSSKGDWTHPERVEKTFEIIYVTSGLVRLREEETLYEVPRGALLVLEPGRMHVGVGIEQNVSFYWLHFHTQDGRLPFRSRFFESFSVPHVFKELLHYAFLPTPHEAMVNALLVRILTELEFSERTISASDKQAEMIYEWLRVNASARLRIADVARHFGFSPDYLSRLVKKQYGASAKDILDTFLLNRAKGLLANTEKYVKEIAYELEFSDDKAFIGFFKYHEGVYPSEFRNRYYRIHMNNR